MSTTPNPELRDVEITHKDSGEVKIVSRPTANDMRNLGWKITRTTDVHRAS